MRVNETSANEIYITPSRVHIYNPGALVPGTNPEMFARREQGSMIRNPLIATVLYCDRSIDAFGTGFIDSYNESINDPINELTEDENRILEIIKSGRKLTKDELAQEIGKSKATVQRCIKSLIDLGFIRRLGSNKTGYWVGL